MDITIIVLSFVFTVPLFLLDVMKCEFSGQIFEKYSNVKFRENPSSEGRVCPCGQTDTTKLIVACSNAPKTMSLA